MKDETKTDTTIDGRKKTSAERKKNVRNRFKSIHSMEKSIRNELYLLAHHYIDDHFVCLFFHYARTNRPIEQAFNFESPNYRTNRGFHSIEVHLESQLNPFQFIYCYYYFGMGKSYETTGKKIDTN